MHNQRGFTILQLSAFIGASAVAAAVIVPSFIEGSRANLSYQAASEIRNIQDAARWFWFESGENMSSRRWPGQQVNDCLPSGTVVADLTQGVTAKLLANAFTNPWGQPYQVTFQGPLGRDCLLSIATRLPESAAPAVARLLPGTVCGAQACGLAAPAGESVCCASIPPAGQELGIDSAIDIDREELCEYLGGEVVNVPGGNWRIKPEQWDGITEPPINFAEAWFRREFMDDPIWADQWNHENLQCKVRSDILDRGHANCRWMNDGCTDPGWADAVVMRVQCDRWREETVQVPDPNDPNQTIDTIERSCLHMRNYCCRPSIGDLTEVAP